MSKLFRMTYVRPLGRVIPVDEDLLDILSRQAEVCHMNKHHSYLNAALWLLFFGICATAILIWGVR